MDQSSQHKLNGFSGNDLRAIRRDRDDAGLGKKGQQCRMHGSGLTGRFCRLSVGRQIKSRLWRRRADHGLDYGVRQWCGN
jgi:hypothetical protein